MGNKGRDRGKETDKIVLSGQQMIVDNQAEKLKEKEQMKQMEQRAAAEGGALEEDDAPGDRPCSVYALGAACSGGFLGATYGFGLKMVMHRGKGRLKAARAEALTSAKAFAVFGGVYALANCIIQRLRQKEDAVTSGAAGAVTGFVMGIGGGPQNALASAAMMGAFSLVLDNVGKTAEAEATQQQQALQRTCSSRPNPQIAVTGKAAEEQEDKSKGEG